MPSIPVKNHPTIACCGIDCGLCPRFYTEGASRCPGCAGEGFAEKHPSCSILTCCVVKHGFETCADCDDFPCQKMQKWDGGDSFVTHRVCLINLRDIHKDGVPAFIRQQKQRMDLLHDLLEHHDDGRSKSFYCLAAALLPISGLKAAIAEGKGNAAASRDRKLAARLLREAFTRIAVENGIELTYRRRAAG
jgi:hypothetical protein